MNTNDMIKWAEALESGEYEQYIGGWGLGWGSSINAAVNYNRDPEEIGHCCLNVACEVLAGKNIGEMAEDSEQAVGQVMVLLGIEKDDVLNFIKMNDQEGYDFPKIAQHVREMVNVNAT